MILFEAICLVGYGVLLYLGCCIILACAKSAFQAIEKGWLNIVFHGSLTGAKGEKSKK